LAEKKGKGHQKGDNLRRRKKKGGIFPPASRRRRKESFTGKTAILKEKGRGSGNDQRGGEQKRLLLSENEEIQGRVAGRGGRNVVYRGREGF